MDLIGKLREQIMDVRYVYEALEVVCTESGLSAATLEIANETLYTHITGGVTEDLVIPFESFQFDTLCKLSLAISGYSGYRSNLLHDASYQKKSTELQKINTIDINRTAAIIHTRLYSDGELERILENAVKAHDEAFTLTNLPKSEERLVFILAKVGVYRDLAGDVVKREKMDMEVDDLLRLARDWENAYYRQRKEQKERVGRYQDYGDEGDLIVSTLQRPSLRTGRMAPLHGNRPPIKPVIHKPIILDSGDIRIGWDRIRDEDFRKLILYRDTNPNVTYEDSTEVCTSTDIKKLFYDDNPTTAGDYYYRLYVEDLHEEKTSSLVVMVRKP